MSDFTISESQALEAVGLVANPHNRRRIRAALPWEPYQTEGGTLARRYRQSDLDAYAVEVATNAMEISRHLTKLDEQHF